MRALWVSVVLCVLLSACAGSRRDSGIAPLSATDAEGIVVLSVTQDEKPGSYVTSSAVFMNATMTQGKNPSYQVLTTRARGPLYPLVRDLAPTEIEGTYGRLHAVKLPAGAHELTGWEIVSMLNQRPETVVRLRAPMRLDAKAGEVAYVGNIHFNLDTRQDALGRAAPVAGYAEIRDERARDIALFEKKYPAMKGSVKPVVMRLGPWTSSPTGAKQIEMERK